MSYNINEIFIADSNWKIKHLSKIKNNYKKSKFFYVIFEKINLLFDDLVTDNLSDINKTIIMACSKWLCCDTRFNSSSSLKLKDTLRGENRIFKIIKHFKYTSYISGEGGKNYLNSKRFESEDIKLIYTNYLGTPYNQIASSENFISRLSILDLLFNLGIEETRIYINEAFQIK